MIGDNTNVATSKAGSVAHFEAETLVENLLREMKGEKPLPSFDGHSNCFIETGFGKAMLIDFNYDLEPLPGRFPLPGVGPMTLLGESRLNHWGKRSLAYPIKKREMGYYVVANFQADTTALPELLFVPVLMTPKTCVRCGRLAFTPTSMPSKVYFRDQ